MTLVTLKFGPRKAAVRLVVNRLKPPLWASADEGATISVPVRDVQSSGVPVSKVEVRPVVLGGGPGGSEILSMRKSSM